MQRLQADAVVPRFVQRRDVDPRHLSQIPQQLGTGQASVLGLGHHQPDLGQQFLTIPQRDEIKERGIGLGIARGCGASGKDQRRCRRITQRQIASISRPDGHAAQIQHLQDVGGAEFVTQAETEDVERRQWSAAFNTEQGLLSLPQSGGEISGRQIGPIAELTGDRVENRIKNDVAQVAGAHLVDLGVGERPTHLSCMPVPQLHAKLVAHVAGGLVDAAVHQLVKINRLIQGRHDHDGCPYS